MKTLKGFLLFVSLLSFGCEKDGILSEGKKEIQNCKPSTEFYLTGNLLGTQECWNDRGSNSGGKYAIVSSGSGACGQGYENTPFQYMALGIRAAEMEGFNNKRYLSIEIPFQCDAFSTKEKFYGLLTPGKYTYRHEQLSYGKFIISYHDGKESFSTDNISQGDNTVEVLTVERVFLPGGNVHHALKVKMKINCILSDSQGKVYGSLKNVEVSGIVLRQRPWGETYADWEG